MAEKTKRIIFLEHNNKCTWKLRKFPFQPQRIVAINNFGHSAFSMCCMALVEFSSIVFYSFCGCFFFMRPKIVRILCTCTCICLHLLMLESGKSMSCPTAHNIKIYCYSEMNACSNLFSLPRHRSSDVPIFCYVHFSSRPNSFFGFGFLFFT